MRPLRSLGRWLARGELEDAQTKAGFWEEVAHARYVETREAQAAAAEMLDGIDVGLVKLEVTRRFQAPTKVRITYGDHVMFDGEANLPLLTFEATR